jgi:hypothetical protein
MNTETKPDKSNQDTRAELERLLQQAEQGDRSVLPRLRAALTANPEVWQRYGDLAAQAVGAMIALASGHNLLMSESLLFKVRELKEEVGGPSPSPLERLLVERVVATWLHANYADALVAQQAGAQAGPATLRDRSQLQQAAERRHQAAIKQLALVRRLLKPAPSPPDLLRKPARETPPASRRGGLRLHDPGLND